LGKLAAMGTKIRNPVARSPLLGKSAVHEKTKSAKRTKTKQKLRTALAEAEAEAESSKDQN